MDSQSGETFGRFNNVDILYGVRLGPSPHSPRVDVAVVSDRGCDRVRFYKIDLTGPGGPLLDITAAGVPRVFLDVTSSRHRCSRRAQSRGGATIPWTTRTLSTA